MKLFVTKRSKILCELLCIVLAFALTIGSVMVFADEADKAELAEDEIQIVKFIKDAPIGTRLSQEYFEVVVVKKLNVPANVVSDPVAFQNKYMLENAYAGEYLYLEQISDTFVSTADENLLLKKIGKSRNDYVNVTEYVMPNTGDNLAYFLQEIIDNNPNRCIYFPAGEYIIAEPLKTSSNPKESVSILLDDGAIIKAADNWKGSGDNALICFGGTEMVNDIKSVGSYYTLIGGIFDANGKANGIAMSAGRESLVRNVCILNAKIGISIPRATNNTSSDLDFEDITIIGNGKSGTIGIDNHAQDNTYTNIRIYDMEIGASNLGGEVKNIYVVNTEKSAAIANKNIGIKGGGGGRVTSCYVENCAIAYDVNAAANSSILNDCIAVWTSATWKKQTVFAKQKAIMQVSGCRATFLPGEGITTTIVDDQNGNGTTYFECCAFDTAVGALPENYAGTPIIDIAN